MEGYDTILIGNLYAYPSFQKAYGTYYPDLKESIITGPWQIGLGDAASVGSIIGLIINGYVTERFGHRRVIIACLVFLSAFIFMRFFATSIEVLCVGQVLIGIPWGIFAIMGSAYSSEVCPLPLRGFLTSFVNICWVIGQFIGAGVLEGLVNNTTKWSYKIPFAIQWVWPIPLIIVAFLAPESPWWLIRKGRVADAEKSIKRLSSSLTPDQIRLKIAMMVHTNNYEKALLMESSFLDCFRGTNLRRTEIACMILAGQAFAGEAFAYNATYFFTQAGLEASNAYKMNFGATGLAFVATVVSWFLMNYFGRRTLLLAGFGTLCLDLLLIGVLSYAHESGAMWAQAAFALIWLGLYSSLVGPESFTVAAEISATRVRAQTLSIARNAYNIATIFGNTIEPYLINPTYAGLKGKTALVWFGICFLTLVWTVLRLPETRGRTYEELDVLFEKRIPAWKFSSTQMDLIAETGVVTGLEEKQSAIAVHVE